MQFYRQRKNPQAYVASDLSVIITKCVFGNDRLFKVCAVTYLYAFRKRYRKLHTLPMVRPITQLQMALGDSERLFKVICVIFLVDSPL